LWVIYQEGENLSNDSTLTKKLCKNTNFYYSNNPSEDLENARKQSIIWLKQKIRDAKQFEKTIALWKELALSEKGNLPKYLLICYFSLNNNETAIVICLKLYKWTNT
jgi:hypothetical protein